MSMFSRILKGKSKKQAFEEENLDIHQEGSDHEYESSHEEEEEEETESEQSEVEITHRHAKTNRSQPAKNSESFFKRIIKGRVDDESTVQSNDHVHLYYAREASEQTFQKEEQRRKMLDQHKQREDDELQYALKQSKLQQKVQELQYQQQLDSDFDLLHIDTTSSIPLHPQEISEEEALKLSILESEQLRAIQEAECYSPEYHHLTPSSAYTNQAQDQPAFYEQQPAMYISPNEGYSHGLTYSPNSNPNAVHDNSNRGLSGKKSSFRRIAETADDVTHHSRSSHPPAHDLLKKATTNTTSNSSKGNETTLDDPEVQAFVARRLAKKEIKRNEEIVLEAQRMKIAPEKIMSELLARSTSMQITSTTHRNNNSNKQQELGLARSTSEQIASYANRKENASNVLQMPFMQANDGSVRQQQSELEAYAAPAPAPAPALAVATSSSQAYMQPLQYDQQHQQQAMQLLQKDMMMDMMTAPPWQQQQPLPEQQGLPRANSYDSATRSIGMNSHQAKHSKHNKQKQQQQQQQQAVYDQQPQYWQSDSHNTGIIPEYSGNSNAQHHLLYGEHERMQVEARTPDPSHILHNDNALALKAATALLKLARRHPLLAAYQSGGGGGGRESAAVELATMWLMQTAETLPPIPQAKNKDKAHDKAIVPEAAVVMSVKHDSGSDCAGSNKQFSPISDNDKQQRFFPPAEEQAGQGQSQSQRRTQRADSRLSSDPPSSGGGRIPVPPIQVQQQWSQQPAQQQSVAVLAPSVPVVDHDKPWRCGVCTLINIPDHLACNACGNPRC